MVRVGILRFVIVVVEILRMRMVSTGYSAGALLVLGPRM